jgi:hypothetical protein
MAQRPLIGTSLDQISTNGMLGDLAFQDSSGAYIDVLRGSTSLEKLSKELTDTAVDIFVYDTRKDSDGGAWRKRTQHTSWYNETLNTATRGSRREFPAVAVIVAETGQVTIYDGDDPDLPMWMVFNQGGSYVTTNNLIGATSGTNSAIICLNGILSLTSTEAIYLIKFISDRTQRITNFADRKYLGVIGERNSGKGLSESNSTNYIVNSNCKDVAMTVLPNAPIDDATGLPIPTIAVATDDGVSVIKDDGNVWDIYPSSGGSSSSFGAADGIYIDSEYVYFGFERLGALNHYIMRIPIPNSDLYPGAGAPYYYNSNWWQGVSENTPINNGNGTVSGKLLSRGDTFYIGGTKDDGTVLTPSLAIHERNPINKNAGLTCAITKSYNSGWMHGSIRGAFLSDTDATNVTGTELITNGTFDTDTTGWTAVGSATLSVDSGQLVVTGGGFPGAGALQGFTTVVGKRYVLTYDAFAGSINVGQIKIGTSPSSFNITFDNNVNSSSNADLYFTATTTTTYITLGLNVGLASSDSFRYDNVSVRLAEEDRSVNNKGLQVFGTIPKSAVATGAELVAYSGFSNNTNFLRQPYNSGLDFGTGNFSTMCWFKMSDISQVGFIFDRANVSSEGNRMALYTESSYLKFYTYDGTGSEEQCILTGLSNTWINVVAIRNSSGVMELYLNGQLKSSTARVVRNVTNTTASTTIGARYTGATNSFPGSVSLLRISASIPSPEQIKKIYEDEKVLFQPNSQCTLYGSSDAVTALAYDDSTNLLYAGTSSGRSDFQGLRRINNTTTAVTTAISASNGLVAEQ